MKKITLMGNSIVTDNLLPCPFCGGKASIFLAQKGNPIDRYFNAIVRCGSTGWVVEDIYKNGMTGSCLAEMEESFSLRAETIEKINEEDLAMAVELLTKRWNNRTPKT